MGEITAIFIHPSYRRVGLGDSLLDFVEQELRQKGFRRIALVVEAGRCGRCKLATSFALFLSTTSWGPRPLVQHGA